MQPNDFLPEPLPIDPLPLFGEWFETARARAAQPNPDAMVLATVDAAHHPAARVVLCKQLDAVAGYIVFFTNYHSRKGQELNIQPRAAAVMHWDTLHRQVRLEGTVVKTPTTDSEQYFAQRPLPSRLGAWASLQSQPLSSRQCLADAVAATAKRFGVALTDSSGTVPRPPHWGGYRLWIDAIELWVEGPGRVHDRARWTRSLQPQDAHTFIPSSWQTSRLYP